MQFVNVTYGDQQTYMQTIDFSGESSNLTGYSETYY